MTCLDFSNITPQMIDSLYEEYTTFIKSSNDTISKMNLDELNWNCLLQPQITFENQMELKRSILKLSQLHPSKEIRDKLSETDVKLSQFTLNECMRLDTFKVYNHYNQNQFQKENLSSEQRTHFTKMIRELKRLGLELEESKYEELKQLKLNLIKIEEEFNKNCSEHKQEFFFTKEELDGMDKKWLELRNNKDLYKVTLSYPDYIPLNQFCNVRETRRVMTDAFMSKCTGPNTKLLFEAVQIRQKIASLLGFNTYADYTLENKMAKNEHTVLTFLNELDGNLTKVLQSDLEKIQSLTDVKIDYYDINYYSRVYTEKTLNFSKQELKKYFTLEKVTDGMMEIYQRFLGLIFKEVTLENKEKFWHEDVRMFEVYENSSNILMTNLLGVFYLDLHPREGKYTHACMMDVVTKSSDNLPVVFMICNFPKDENLSFDDVETYFHEFGHVMHGICSESTLSSLGGTSCERDFVEAPSQLFEEWCYREEPLKLMAPDLPQKYIEILNTERKMLQGLFNKRQLVFGLYDMTLHASKKLELNDVKKCFQDIYKKLMGLELPESVDFGASFGHLMGGYSAGYYSYLWSLVYAKDMYKSVIKGNELNEDVGRRFRKIILSRGGTIDSIESVREFLGREPNSVAFAEDLI